MKKTVEDWVEILKSGELEPRAFIAAIQEEEHYYSLVEAESELWNYDNDLKCIRERFNKKVRGAVPHYLRGSLCEVRDNDANPDKP